MGTENKELKMVLNTKEKEAGYTELFNACRDNNLELVKLLLEQGVKVSYGNNVPVRIAAGKGNLEIVKYLVSKGADITDSNYGAVIFAATENRLEVVKYLVEMEAYNTEALEVSMMYAVQLNHNDIVKYLVSKNVRIQDEVFLQACRAGKDEIVQKYISEGIDIHIAANQALSVVAGSSNRGNVLRILLSHGGIAQKDIDSAMIAAIRNNQFNATKILVSKGANVNATNALAFKTAIRNRRVDIMKYLIDNGCNINPTKFVVSVGSNKHDLPILQYLVSLGGDVTTENNRALFLASRITDNEELIDYLKSKGAVLKNIESDEDLK